MKTIEKSKVLRYDESINGKPVKTVAIRVKPKKVTVSPAIKYIRLLKRKEFELQIRMQLIQDELAEITRELKRDFEPSGYDSRIRNTDDDTEQNC